MGVDGDGVSGKFGARKEAPEQASDSKNVRPPLTHAISRHVTEPTSQCSRVSLTFFPIVSLASSPRGPSLPFPRP